MKILLSAYACEPNKGSEPSVGWHWAIELAYLGHEVFVLTRESNRKAIEAQFANKKEPPNLKFRYYDLPAWARRLKRGNRGIHFYYLFWQWGAFHVARKAHRAHRFDCVHHVTFVGIRLPSFMGLLGIPFILGPLGGGEIVPWPLRRYYTIGAHIVELLRDVSGIWIRFSPLMRLTFYSATTIYVTSRQCLALLPKSCRSKAEIRLAIGVDDEFIASRNPRGRSRHEFRILYIGQYLHLKGMDFGLRAFARALASNDALRLTMVGDGPAGTSWQCLADSLRISRYIEWQPWSPRASLKEFYMSNDMFLFPSLHDSGGMVVLEALASGLPTLCLDLGGPGEIVNQSCGYAVPVINKSAGDVVCELAAAILKIEGDKHLYGMLSCGAIARAECFRWTKRVQDFDAYSYGKSSRQLSV